MRILGHHGLERRYRDVPLGRFDDNGEQAKLRLYAVSFSTLQQVEDEFEDPPFPQPPLAKGVETNDRGEPVLDANGARVAKRDAKAPSHIKAIMDRQRVIQRMARAKSVALVVAAAEGGLEFDHERQEGMSGLEHYETLWSEMEKGGIDAGRFGKLDQAVADMMELSAAEVETADAALEVLDGGPTEGN